MQPIFLPPSDSDSDALPAFLRDRPRRPALPPPPPGYFDALPAQVLTRIRATEKARATRWLPAALDVDLSRLRWPRLRLAFTAGVLTAAFTGAFWLGQVTPGARPTGAERTLVTVQTADLIAYLADPTTPRLLSDDLARLSSADHAPDVTPLPVSGAALDAVLAELPFDEAYL